MDIKEIIREATADDTDTLIKIAVNEWRAIYEGYREQLGDEIFPLFFDDYENIKADQIRENMRHGNVYVTECDGRIAGFFHFTYLEDKKIGILLNNAVSGEYRGRGIGGRQYEAAFDMLRKLGALAVQVTTGLDDAHAPARRAYEKAGFSASTSSITYYKKL